MAIAAAGAVGLGQPVLGLLQGFLVLGAAVWIGGLAAIFVTARVARRTLQPRERVAFFRGLGRAYGPVGGTALTVALGCGAALLYGRAWDGALIAATVIAACLLAVTTAGVAQARRMTQLRQAALRRPADLNLAVRVQRGALNARALRAMIAALSLVLVALAVVLAP